MSLGAAYRYDDGSGSVWIIGDQAYRYYPEGRGVVPVGGGRRHMSQYIGAYPHEVRLIEDAPFISDNGIDASATEQEKP